ncbi:MAG: type III restriction-modification system endonuclease [Gemmatimonadaceae bacterium]
MRLHFDPGLSHQLQAINAACDLFRGQESCRTGFTISLPLAAGQLSLGVDQGDFGVGNRLALTDEALLANLRDIQVRNGLTPSEALGHPREFTVEMETGTGKTYVYLRTILELHKRYSFSKFVIVVPSIAIKEGVRKTLEMTRDHFRSLYAGMLYEYFVYESARLGQVRNFAASPSVQIMVVTVGAINKKAVNNLYKPNERTSDEPPVELIRAARPIVIVDEPQSVDGGLNGAGRAALKEMDPLCTLRYSATHVDPHHMIYRLDAVDAYEQRLVKQIEVAAATVEDANNRPYVELLSVTSRRGGISATIRADVQRATGVKRDKVTVHDGDDLEIRTGRALYHGYRIGELRARADAQSLELRMPDGERYLGPGDAYGEADPDAVRRELMRRTIREHLDKAVRLHPRGIKVLSLFFIDSVDRYRRYDTEGNPDKGPYAMMFEEEFGHLSRHPDYRALFATGDVAPVAVHDGYFSIDKKNRWTDTAEGNQSDRESAERAYNLIMRDKERLLSLDTPLAFIFSHSALKEGWDNPNVFQICSLRDMHGELERRQTIGRGLRLCVDQSGDRIPGFEVNTLTVIATESYEAFAAGLQREIEQATGIRFGIVEPGQFAAVALADAAGAPKTMGAARSREIWDHLRSESYIDATGRVRDTLRAALRDDTLSLPKFAESKAREIEAILRRVTSRIEVRDAAKRRTIRPRRAVLDGERFRATWERISPKTAYALTFDGDALARECAERLRSAPAIPGARLQWRTAGMDVRRSGIEAVERAGAQTITVAESGTDLPDILTVLQERTGLTRRTLCRVLIDSGRLEDFRRNPQRFVEIAEATINDCTERASVDGILYQQLGDAYVYSVQLFDRETISDLKQVVEDGGSKTPFDYVTCDSETEIAFARDLENNESVTFFAKLPKEFKIPTPLGSYNPDWVVMIEDDGRSRLHFVVETKSSAILNDLRGREALKIECGRRHFDALRVREPRAKYIVAASVDDLMSEVAAARRAEESA